VGISGNPEGRKPAVGAVHSFMLCAAEMSISGRGMTVELCVPWVLGTFENCPQEIEVKYLVNNRLTFFYFSQRLIQLGFVDREGMLCRESGTLRYVVGWGKIFLWCHMV